MFVQLCNFNVISTLLFTRQVVGLWCNNQSDFSYFGDYFGSSSKSWFLKTRKTKPSILPDLIGLYFFLLKFHPQRRFFSNGNFRHRLTEEACSEKVDRTD